MTELSSLPFVPPAGHQPLLPNNAKANAQFGRLLDALLVLDAEGSCRIGELAQRVGLDPQRLRHLLSVFMTAGADAVEGSAPLSISFGTAEGPFGADEEDDAAQDQADVVWLESGHRGRSWLVSELGRRPVLVKDVARALLAGTLVLSDEDLPEERRLGVRALVGRLSESMNATVQAPVGGVVHELQDAIADRRSVKARYLHPWTGSSTVIELEPYDLRRQRDRLVLDAGRDGALGAYDVSGLSDLEVLDRSFEPPVLPPRDSRTPRVPVVLRVPAYSGEESRLESGWSGVVVTSVQEGLVDMRVELDGDLADPVVAERLGVLLLQLGPRVSVVSPEELKRAPVSVAKRFLALHAD